MSETMRYFQATCEVWVKPLFRKARPKIKQTVFAAHNMGEFYDLMRKHYAGHRFKFIGWQEVDANGAKIYP